MNSYIFHWFSKNQPINIFLRKYVFNMYVICVHKFCLEFSKHRPNMNNNPGSRFIYYSSTFLKYVLPEF